MALPNRLFYSLNKAAQKAGCDIEDLFHFFMLGKMFFLMRVNASCDLELDGNSYRSRTDETSISITDKEIESLCLKEQKKDEIRHWKNHIEATDLVDIMLIPHDKETQKGEAPVIKFIINGFMMLYAPEWNPHKGNDVVACYLFNPQESSKNVLNGVVVENVIVQDLPLFVSHNEIELLKNGGREITAFLLGKNIDSRHVDIDITEKAADFIRGLLDLCYSDKEITAKPWLYIDKQETEIYQDFKAKGIIPPSPKTLKRWLDK
jgi:hypothetical protein